LRCGVLRSGTESGREVTGDPGFHEIKYREMIELHTERMQFVAVGLRSQLARDPV
jgi:hypothetical protein